MKWKKILAFVSAVTILSSMSFATFADSNLQADENYNEVREVRATPHYSLAGGFFNTTDIKYIISYSPGAKYSNAIHEAAAMWQNSTNVFSVRKGTRSDYNINVVPSNWGGRDWLSQASLLSDGVDWNGNAIITGGGSWTTSYSRGSVQLNTFYLDDDPQENIRVVTAHEMGHLFGLDHVEYKDVLMYGNGVENAARVNPFLYSRPGNDDVAGAEINCRKWN